MADLISRAALIESLKKQAPPTDDLYKVYLCIIFAPAVDAVPVTHGRWMRADSDTSCSIEYKCSVCGDIAPLGYMRQCALTNYCPHCGAKMDGERRDKDEHPHTTEDQG